VSWQRPNQARSTKMAAVLSLVRVRVPGASLTYPGFSSEAEESRPLLPILLALLLSADLPSPPPGDTVRAVWLADLTAELAHQGHGGFVFVRDSLVDEHDGCHDLEAAEPPGASRTV